MPNSRSRSPDPSHERRQRSRSPRRKESDRPRKGGRGFKWKEKRTNDDERDRGDDRRLERGYRDRDQDRARDKHQDRDRDGHRERERDQDHTRYRGHGGEREVGRNHDSRGSPLRDWKEERAGGESSVEKPKKEKKAKKSSGPAPTSEPMIIVNVNDRLGTKASIPCLASDPVKLFKAQVAARIGREPHEIMLKRQGERPFKDQLTLEDYGVSNGVQLDLEVDTGD